MSPAEPCGLADPSPNEGRATERLLPLRGGRNFRDLGGYRTADGRRVRWGMLYRSGVMSGLTAEDIRYLSQLGLKAICDLRSPEERAAQPSPFVGGGEIELVSADYRLPGALDALAQARTREDAIAGFADVYGEFIDVLGPQYTEMFARIVRGGAPLAVSCTAGKDRTGVAVALILAVLGVPRDTILADYALTETYTPAALYMEQMAHPEAVSATGLTGDRARPFAHLAPAVLQVVMGSDVGVMRRALLDMDAKYGGPIPLAKSRFGLTDASIAQIRAAYLA